MSTEYKLVTSNPSSQIHLVAPPPTPPIAAQPASSNSQEVLVAEDKLNPNVLVSPAATTPPQEVPVASAFEMFKVAPLSDDEANNQYTSTVFDDWLVYSANTIPLEEISIV